MKELILLASLALMLLIQGCTFRHHEETKKDLEERAEFERRYLHPQPAPVDSKPHDDDPDPVI